MRTLSLLVVFFGMIMAIGAIWAGNYGMFVAEHNPSLEWIAFPAFSSAIIFFICGCALVYLGGDLYIDAGKKGGAS